MRLLLDTQVFIWAVTAHQQLSAPARELISEADRVAVSAASIGDIAIKSRLGKIAGDVGAFAEVIEASDFADSTF